MYPRFQFISSGFRTSGASGGALFPHQLVMSTIMRARDGKKVSFSVAR